MKKTLLMTAILGLCSQTLLTVSAQEGDVIEPSEATIESVVSAEDEAGNPIEGIVEVDENLGNEGNEGDAELNEGEPENEKITMTYIFLDQKVSDEFLSEVAYLPYGSAIEVSDSIDEPDGRFRLELVAVDGLTPEQLSELDDLYNRHTSNEKEMIQAPINFNSEEEAQAYADAVVKKGLHDGQNLVHIDYEVKAPETEEDAYTVEFELNKAQIRDEYVADFGQDHMLHLYNELDEVVGEDASEENARLEEAPVEEPEETTVEPSEEAPVETPEETTVEPSEEVPVETPEETTQEDVVDYQVDEKEEVIPFETERVETAELLKGTEKVVQEGVNGILHVKTTQKLVNGVPSGDPVIEKEEKAPVNKVVHVGIGEAENHVETTEEKLPFETETRENNGLKKGVKNVVREGVEGVKVITITTPMFNGQAVGEPQRSEEIKQQPVNKIVEVGTAVEENREERVDKKEEKLPFETEERQTDARKVGERVVIRKGIEGLKEIKTTQVFVDGKPVGQPKVEETVLREPIKEIVEVGTNAQTTTVENQTTTVTQPNANPVTNGQTISPTGQPINNSVNPGTVTTTSEFVTIARKHTVQAGETLQSIAQKYNTTPEKIKSWNALTSDYVYQGQVLTVSDAMRIPVEEYIAVQGDTASSIAERFGMSVGDLQKLNNNDPLSYIVQGQVVKVIDLKKGFGNDANQNTLTENFKDAKPQAPLADKKYEQPRQEEQVVPIPKTGESRLLGIVGVGVLVIGAILAFFGKKKADDGKAE